MKKTNPKLLWVSGNCLLDTSSGASISIRQILIQLAKRNWDIVILTGTIFDSERGTSKLKSTWSTIRKSVGEIIKVIDGNLTHNLLVNEGLLSSEFTTKEATKFVGTYISTLNDFKPDYVFFYGGGILEYSIANESKYKHIPSIKYLVNPGYTHYDRWARDVDLIITDTYATSNYYKKFGHEVVPVGKFIDPSEYVSKLNERKNVLFINPCLQKGVSVVIVLALLLERSRPDIKFEVVESRGSWADMLEIVTKTIGNERKSLTNVIVTKNTSDMKSVYSRAKVLLAPSLWWESGARVIAEAMLSGIPVIATNHGGNLEMMGEGGIAINLPEKMYEKPFSEVPIPGGLKEISELIEKLFDDDAFYNQLSFSAKKYADTNHNIEKNTDRLIYALQSLSADKSAEASLKPIKHNISGKNEDGRYLGSEDRSHVTKISESLPPTVPTKASSKKHLNFPLKPGERGLFIDGGGHDGCSAVMFMLQNPEFDSLTFEPNPVFWDYYHQVPTTLIKQAIYTYSGEIAFTVDETDGDGSSVIAGKKIDFWNKVDNIDCPVIQVPCIDLAEVVNWAKTRYDRIVLKLDVEGAEYDILEHLLSSGLLPAIDVLYCEFHWQKCNIPKERHDRLLAALRHTPVLHWAAQTFSVHGPSSETAIRQRKDLIVESLGDPLVYQQVPYLLPKPLPTPLPTPE